MIESAQEKIERYRRMADSTRELAARTEDPDIRAAYHDLADKWVSLADETARESRGVHEGPVPSPASEAIN